MKSGDQAESGGLWRVQLQDMRTVAALRAPAPPAEAAERLTDRVLCAAAQNPDHSEAGRQAAAEAARARNVSVMPWRLKVPGFIKPSDLAKGERLFFGWGRRIRVWSGAGIYLSIILMVALAYLLTSYANDLFAAEVERTIACEYRGVCAASEFGGAMMAPAGSSAQPAPAPLRERMTEDEFRAELQRIRIQPFDPAFAFLGLVVLAPLTIWFFATILRRKPARVLLLRKFNTRALSEPLSRMLAQELRTYGHVATLSDKHIRRDAFGWVQGAILSLSNPVAFVWFVLGLPIRFVWRLFDRSAMGPAVVLNARDYRNLAKRLRDRIGLNAQVALVSKEAFMVRTSDAWWRMTAKLLMDSSDAIIVDLSQVTEGTAWELDAIQQENAAARCVFVALWGKLEEAEAELRARGIDATVHHYAPDGEIQRRAIFRAAMLSAMRATHGVA